MELLFQLVTAFAAAFLFAMLMNLHGIRKLLYASIGGALGWGVCCGLEGAVSSEVLRYFLASLILTFYSEFMARKFRAPVSVFLVAGSIPMIPGGHLYVTMDLALQGNWEECLKEGMRTLGIASAIAAGILALMMLWRIFAPRPGAQAKE